MQVDRIPCTVFKVPESTVRNRVRVLILSNNRVAIIENEVFPGGLMTRWAFFFGDCMILVFITLFFDSCAKILNHKIAAFLCSDVNLI